MNANVRCAGTPNGWGSNYLWPPPPDQLIRRPCGWEATVDQAQHDGRVCPHCGGQVELHPSGGGS